MVITTSDLSGAEQTTVETILSIMIPWGELPPSTLNTTLLL
jgi:hypothetical protein